VAGNATGHVRSAPRPRKKKEKKKRKKGKVHAIQARWKGLTWWAWGNTEELLLRKGLADRRLGGDRGILRIYSTVSI